VEGGLTIEETVETVKQLKALGCDFVDCSSGGNSPAQKIKIEPGYHVPFAARVRKEAGIKTWAVGIITEPEQAESIIANGEADCTAHARAFMVDPRWGWNAARALGAELPPLPLPAARGASILQFRPSSARARAAE
jgi:2,4-dienoyl-CoA reductase-like NADH-dependent reductase (Old Yellow Enzyme family)